MGLLLAREQTGGKAVWRLIARILCAWKSTQRKHSRLSFTRCTEQQVELYKVHRCIVLTWKSLGDAAAKCWGPEGVSRPKTFPSWCSLRRLADDLVAAILFCY